ncbi:MAG: 3-dehydroquinate synthase [Acutalibacteraceae bacterium]
MINIDVCKSKIIIGASIANNLAKIVLDCHKPCKIFIISDSNIADIYLRNLKSQLQEAGFQIYCCIVPPGECSKTLDTINFIYKKLSSDLISKNDIIVSLGGGVISDISGFVASTYKRGVELINIPTSFLAMIDASIGGKNAVNLEYGKNLVGSFYFPGLVLIDYNFLNTLPQKELHSGISEAIKCGAIFDAQLFEILEKENFADNIESIIYRSISVKKKLVEKDKFDSNVRMLLNFGHTIGHAIENLYGYKNISHGEAVSIGMNEVTKISEKLGLSAGNVSERLQNICEKFSLPVKSQFPIEKLSKAILQDKKISGEYINLVLLKEIGKSFIFKISNDRINNFLEGREI